MYVYSHLSMIYLSANVAACVACLQSSAKEVLRDIGLEKARGTTFCWIKWMLSCDWELIFHAYQSIVITRPWQLFDTFFSDKDLVSMGRTFEP